MWQLSSVCFVPKLWAVFPRSVSYPPVPLAAAKEHKSSLGSHVNDTESPPWRIFPMTLTATCTEARRFFYLHAFPVSFPTCSESSTSVTRPVTLFMFHLSNILFSVVYTSQSLNVADICLASQTGRDTLVNVIKLYLGIWMPKIGAGSDRKWGK